MPNLLLCDYNIGTATSTIPEIVILAVIHESPDVVHLTGVPYCHHEQHLGSQSRQFPWVTSRNVSVEFLFDVVVLGVSAMVIRCN